MIEALPFSLSVTGLREELSAHPDVWDRYRWRTEHPRSPHREVSDIWCRYNALDNLGPNFNDEHESVWYPVVDKLPSVPLLCDAVMAQLDNRELAGVLITKVPAGKQVYPHVDRGWHAENTDKVGVLVQGNLGQSFCYDGIQHRCVAGNCFLFENQVSHWVENPTAEDRITLIVCMRRSH